MKKKEHKNTTCTRDEWINFVAKFQEDEGMYTFFQAESLVLALIKEGRMERPQTKC